MATLNSELRADSTVSAAALSIPFSIHAEMSCVNVPMSLGLCIPKGRLFEAASATVAFETSADSEIVHADVHVNGRWQDGSIRWVLLDFVAAELAAGTTTVSTTFETATLSGELNSALDSRRNTSRFVGRTNGMSLDINGQTTNVAVELLDHEGNSLELSAVTTKETKSGVNRHCWQAVFAVDEQADVAVQVTLDVWPQIGIVDVSTRLRNGRRAIHSGGLWDLGDSRSFHFSNLSVQLQPGGETMASEKRLAYSVDGVSTAKSTTDSFSVTQASSGGPQWDCSNHIDGDGNQTVKSNGYELVVGNTTSRGLQASPTVMYSDDQRRLAVAVPEFWQQFPGRLACDPSEGTVSVGLFPKEAGIPFELQGGEQKTKRFVFQVLPAEPASQLEALAWVHTPPRHLPNPSWVRKCNVIPWLPNADQVASANVKHHQRLGRYLTEATTDSYSISNRRDSIDEYGWRNFGDIHADHEQTHFAGPGAVVSHYNNQFDLVFGAIQNLIVGGKTAWYDLFDPMARHVMDIDIYHTDQDRACFNGGLFWHTDHYVDARTATHRTYSAKNAGDGAYGGGPSNEHNYPTGLLYYHYLTGSEEAKECVISLADWVINMDDGRQTVFGMIDGNDTGLASKTVWEDFHGPGRGVGNSINACLDGWLLTADKKYLTKADHLIKRCVHPCQDLDALHLADAEGHWSYTVCLTALGRYLHVKAADDLLDEMYEYVRQTLVHYGQWMEQNEKPSLSVPEDLEYPTEAWAAQDFRKANVLRIAASCCQDSEAGKRMKSAADRIHEAAWADLYKFGNAHLTARCLSIIMTEGLRELYHVSADQASVPVGKPVSVEPNWTMFQLQKHRVKSTLKNPLQLLKAIVTQVRPKSIRQSLQAFRRQTQS